MAQTSGKSEKTAAQRKSAQRAEYLQSVYGKKTSASKEWVAKASSAFKAKPRKAVGKVTAPKLSGESLESIRADLGDCTRCKLSKTRTHIVYGEGNPKAELLFVGEGPGENEDLQARPFVGRAGQLLDKIIEAMGMKRSDVYIANVVKCRPPNNRPPERDEVETCSLFLFRQIDVIKPKVIVALGATALKSLFGDDVKITRKITEMRGQFTEFRGTKLMPTYHPAYLLRNPPAKKDVWDDMKIVMKELNK